VALSTGVRLPVSMAEVFPAGCHLLPDSITRTPFEAVEFEGLTVTPYVDTGRCTGQGRCGARMAFSLRATGLKAAARPAPSKDAA